MQPDQKLNQLVKIQRISMIHTMLTKVVQYYEKLSKNIEKD